MEEFDPISRIEYFLDAVLNGDPAPFEPYARAEYYLAYLCGSGVALPTPQSSVDYYLAYKCGVDVTIPEPINRIDFYLAKWCGEDVETPDPIHPIEFYLAQLANSGELKTVSGNPISVSDALARPAESLVIEILPQQSGSGDPSPDNVRPISGFTGVDIYRESAYDPDADPTYSISWQTEAGTVYGGSLDVTSGVLTVERVVETVGTVTSNGIKPWGGLEAKYVPTHSKKYASSTNTAEGLLSDKFKPTDSPVAGWEVNGRAVSGNIFFCFPDTITTIEDANTWFLNNPTQILFLLATPLVIQLTPTEIEMLEGNNTLWNDVGDMTLEYLADGPADDADALQILLGNRYVNNGGADEATDREALDILLGGNTR